MMGSTPRIESAVIFFANTILACYCRFQILEYFNYLGYKKFRFQNEGINIKLHKRQQAW
jgi:hypothetical protein